jgi:hypothetical protein
VSQPQDRLDPDAEPIPACDRAVKALRRAAEGHPLTEADAEAFRNLATLLEKVSKEVDHLRGIIGYDSGNWTEDDSERHWGVGSVFRCWNDWVWDDCKCMPEGHLIGATDGLEQMGEAIEGAEDLLNLLDAFTGVDPLPEQQGGPKE